MQKMILLDKNNQKLFVGTKQDCMQFVKARKLPRGTYTVQPYVVQTVPVVPEVIILDDKRAVVEPKLSWYKRIFK